MSPLDFNKQFRVAEQDIQDTDAFSSSYTSTGVSESGRTSPSSPSRFITTDEDDDGDGGGSQSTLYTIQESRRLGSPLLSPRGFTSGSDSTHYDIGSPRSDESTTDDD